MAYTHSKYEVPLILSTGGQTDFTPTTSTARRTWAPGYVPHVVRAVSFVVLASGAAASARRIKLGLFKNSITAIGASATTNYTAIDTATLSSLLSRGKVQYVDGLNTEIAPGEQLVVKSLQAVTQAARLAAYAYVEPRWEVPGNNSDMSDRT